MSGPAGVTGIWGRRAQVTMIGRTSTDIPLGNPGVVSLMMF
ncbi:hypothetical protein [Synoicihabitans lomoniglobus]